MLLYYTVENSYSFFEKATLDMRATTQKDNPDFVISKNGNRILPIASIYGPNASGKSNLIRSLEHFLKNIQLSASFEEGKRLFCFPYYLSKTAHQEPTYCEALLQIDSLDHDGLEPAESYEYKYAYSITRDKVLNEALYSRKAGTKHEFKSLFERTNNEVQLFGALEESTQAKVLKDMVKDNKLYLSWMGIQGIYPAQGIYDWCSKASCHVPLKEKEQLKITAEILSSQSKEKQDLVDFIKSFDLQIETISADKNEGVNRDDEYTVFFNHTTEDDRTLRFISNLESAGTNRMLLVYPNFLSCFDKGGLLIIDELDQNFHPLLLRKLIGIFHDKSINKSNAQLIFVSHNLIVLDAQDMRRDEIWFVDKGKSSRSKLYSLAKYKEDGKSVRPDRDYGKNYLAGCFEAIPPQRNEG